jgi:hypothetical protein
MCVAPHDLCVIREDGDLSRWEVAVCHYGQRERLAEFGSFEEAAEFALARCDESRRRDNYELNVHFPDDCPCCRVAQQLVSLSI